MGLVVQATLFVKDHWKQIIPILLGIILLPLMFSSATTVALTYPAVDESTMRLYIEIARDVGEGKSFINYKDLIAIDGVRYKQDFKKATRSNITALANRFLQENRQDTNYNFNNLYEIVQIVNNELGVSIDYREVIMVNALLTNEAFNSSNYELKELARKFVRIDRIPYEEVVEKEVTVEKVIRTWKSALPWLPDSVTQKLGWGSWVESIEYDTKIIYETVVKYREGKEVIPYTKVLQDLGYNESQIPEFFKNKSNISTNMTKTVITYTTKPFDSVLKELSFNSEEVQMAKLLRDVGMNLKGGGGNWNGSGENTPESASEFIERVVDGSVSGYKKYGVYPSITIAQAILESGWGKSGLTARANNLFGVKADGSWSGGYIEMETREVFNGQEVFITARFRAYESWKHSLEDHGLFLVENSRYSQHGLFSAKDYIGQAYALQSAGYATDPEYPILLISIIQQYGLDKYDKS